MESNQVQILSESNSLIVMNHKNRYRKILIIPLFEIIGSHHEEDLKAQNYKPTYHLLLDYKL